MDQRRGLKRVIGTLTSHVAGRQPVKLVIHQRHQFVERPRIAVSPIQEQLGHASWRAGRHITSPAVEESNLYVHRAAAEELGVIESLGCGGSSTRVSGAAAHRKDQPRFSYDAQPAYDALNF